MWGVFRPGPKFLSVVSSLRARCVSVRTEIPGEIFQCVDARRFSARPEIPGDIYQFGCVGFFQSGPNFLAIFPRSNAMSFSVRTKVPGDFFQVECEAFFGQYQNSWRYFPIRTRGVVWSGPKFLAACPSLNAKRLSDRTEIPGDISQFEFAELLGQNRNSWRRFPV